MNPPRPGAAALPSGIVYHPALGQVRYSVREVRDSSPEAQVTDVVAIMREWAIEDSLNPIVRQDAAIAHSSGDPISDTWGYLRRGGIRGMRFVRDEETYAPLTELENTPRGWEPLVESIARPELLAQSGDPHGDCDCFCTYGAAHLLARGVPCGFVTVAADKDTPTLYTHVYLVAYPERGPYAGQRVPLDLSHGAYPGWEVQKVFRRREWMVQTQDDVRLLCIGALAAIGAGALFYQATRKETGIFA